MNTPHEALGLRQAVTNLLDNVRRYTRPVGRVQISLEVSADSIELTVEQAHGEGSGDGSSFVVRLPAVRTNVVRGGLAAWQLKRVLQFIHANLDQPITVDAIAAVAGQSASHFHRVFKRSLGTTVHLYVMFRRIEMAQRLMMDTSEPLSTIAVACGMCDQSHLTRWFTRVSGESPNQWRRARTDAARTRMSLPDRHSVLPKVVHGELR
jgi:AraC-like DNA-binding protein